MEAYYGARFSANMTRTPEGFLICHNVPLARTGEQDYLGSEVGEPDLPIVKVYRRPEEVFRKATLESFEGKPVTDDHPAEFVAPGNATGYLRGTCTNVRQGTGESSDLIIGDLIIHDATLIAEIEAGKREISAGYLCDYRACDGGLEQCNIICNHIAVVHNGRAGSRVAIKDSKPKLQNGGIRMSKKNILNRMLAVFMRDEETTPEDVKAALDAVAEPESPKEEKPADPEGNKEEEVKKAVDAAVAPLLTRIAELEAKLTKDEDPDDLDKLEKDLAEEDSVDREEKATTPPEDIKTNDEEEQAPVVDKAVALHLLRIMKPTIAGFPEEHKKQAVDSLRKALTTPDKQAKDKKIDTEYAKLLKRKAADSKTVVNNTDFGEACRAFNPHVKKEGK